MLVLVHKEPWAVVSGCLALLIAVLVMEIWRWLWGLEHRRRRLPPGPTPWPLLGNLPQLGLRPHRAIDAMLQRHGPLVFLRLGPHINAIATHDPAILRDILGKLDDAFSSRPRSIATDYLSYRNQDIAFSPMGPHWKAIRGICMEHLLTTRRLVTYRRQREEEAHCMVAEIHSLSLQGAIVTLRKFLCAFSMNCITRMLLGKRFFGPAQSCGPEESARFEQVIHDSMVLLGVVNIADYLPILRSLDLQGYEKQCRRVFADLDTLQSQLLDEHVQKRKITDSHAGDDEGVHTFIDVLLSLRESGMEELTDTVIKAVVEDVIAGGTDTSSANNEWVMAQLLKHPNILKRAQEEIDLVVGRNRLIQETDLPELRYLRCIVMETMRLTPSGPFSIPHCTAKDTQLAGYDIPKGTHVLISIYSHGRNKKIWGEDVEVFRPDRHLQEETRVENSNGPEMKYIMFGGGRRRCPGAPLGMTLIMLALGHLLQCFEWTLPPGIDDVDLSDVSCLAAPPATPLQAVATPRLHKHLYKLMQ
ncbi:hypothetical protein KP509_26G020300 [Ceratopteris richardii]|uniref:Cytochrome P450 n=1 Tax=Ceratopteris richardii TaxID=49495 RepID=A0A8T2RK63_CERRI|nr:hypothetical protein KP509_26G020300 [Ceratopteris richardii]